MPHTRILLLVAGLVLVVGNLWVNRWPSTLYYGDSNGYYLHVVSFFVNQDVGDYDKTITSLQDVNPGSSDPRDDEFGIRLTEKGRRYIKYTLGVPVMETPFFLLGHAYAKLSPHYEANGWSRPYIISVGFSLVFYVLLGLYLLIGVLKRYFDNRTVTYVVLALILATNLFYQTTYVTMSHGFLFFQHGLLIWLTVKFYDKPSWQRALGLGLTVGLITLTRVPEMVAALFVVLWGITSFKLLQQRFEFFLKNAHYLALAALGFGLVFSLQIAYWYYVSGYFVFNPYQGEGFDFMKPRIFKAFFDFKNGWLIYTPIMAFAVVGLFKLPKYAKGVLLPILGFVVLQVWIHYSYYVYSYFPGMGQRPMVETYGYLSFGLAASFAALLASKRWRWLPATALVLFGSLNLFQVWQSKEGVIWTERHNAAFYWESFATLKSSLNALRAYDSGSLQPKDDEVELVKVLASEGFEDTTQLYRSGLSQQQVAEGAYAYLSPQEHLVLVENLPLADAGSKWLKARIKAFIDAGGVPANRDDAASLVVALYDENGKRRRYRSIQISPFLGNDEGSIWTSGQANVWGEASFFTKLPNKVKKGWTVDVYVRNEPNQLIYLDDFKLELYEEK